MEIDDDDLYSDVFLPDRPVVSASTPPLAASAASTSTGATTSVADSDSDDDLIVLNDTIGVLDPYVRPGGPAGGVTGPQGQLRPPLPTGPYPGRGRGDWRPAGARTMNGRGYGNQMPLEFSLPSQKTIFDFEIDNLEDKGWRRPGADQTDYFNLGFNQESWNDYFKRLASFHYSP